MTAAVLAFARPDLETGDRFELTANARPKLRPKGSPRGVIHDDEGDYWRVQFDGSPERRSICKRFVQAEGRR
jgi:hypothetical protein